MKQVTFIASFLFLSTSFSLTAQQLIFKTYTVEDGLVANPVRRIYQDSRGFIWIGTWEGLSKYDGYKFTNYTTANGLSHNLVNDMYESADGKLYVAENNGTVDILQQDAIVKKAAFRNVIINQFYITQNDRVIAATDSGGLQEIKNGNLVKPRQKFPGSTYNDLTDLNDSLLIGGAEGSLSILNRQFELISEIKQPKELLTFKIYKDSKNRVWVGTSNGLKLVSALQKNNQPHSFTLLPVHFNIPVLKNRLVNDILEDANGNFWIATTHGLVKIDTEGVWQVFSDKDRLPSSNITCIYQDKEKNIWIGTTLGLAKLVTKNNIRIYIMEKGLTSNVFGFLLPLKNDLFLTGTETVPQLYNTTNNLFSPVSSQHNFFYTDFIQNSQPVLFFSNNNRFGKYDSVNKRIVDYILPGPPNAEVYCSVMDTNGIIFSGTQKGLIIRSGGKSWYENKLSHRITFLLLDKKGYLWVGTWNNGLYRIHYTNTKNKSDSYQIGLSVQDFSDLLPDKNVRCLFEDSKGNIWVGTRYHGIVQLMYNNTEQFAVEHFDLQRGLMSNWTRVIAEDAKGCIWIGSNLGIDKLIPASNSFRVFNFSRINNFFANINAILLQNDHSLWLSTYTGLVNIIDGESEKTPPPSVYITSVDLGDTSFDFNTHDRDTKVQLKYNQNQAGFEFSAPAFINEKQILYSYRLLGSADTAWSKPANLHNVSYASLQHGNYRFEVRTIGWNGEWGVPANFVFTIQTPFWQTWWFYSLVGLFVLLLLYAFYLYRIRQLLQLQNVRSRIATDLHDDIGSTLTNINILSELSKKNIDHKKEAEIFLNRITEEATTSSQALDDIVWSINKDNDTIDQTIARMRRYAAEIFEAANINYSLQSDEQVANRKLNMEIRRDFYLLFKEAINNIYKHAKATHVEISVWLEKKKLQLQIRDDGKGFDTAASTHRNGIKGMRTRVNKLKGHINIWSEPGKGTSIHISLPFS